MAETTAFSARNIAGRDRLEDYAVDDDFGMFVHENDSC